MANDSILGQGVIRGVTASGTVKNILVDSNGNLISGGTSYTGPVSGELAGSATSVQMPTIVCSLVMFKAEYNNVGRVYIGVSTSVTVADGTTDTTTGLQLSAGESTGWIPVDNVNRFWRICDNAGDDLTYIALV